MATQLPIEIWSAEVKEVIYLDDNPKLIYGIKVAKLDGPGAEDDTSGILQTAVPLNYNILRIPIVGEVVLILRAPSSYTTGIRNTEALYYLDIVSLQRSEHHNALPTISTKSIISISDSSKSNDYENSSTGNTKQTNTPKIDRNFLENSTAKPLQHYVGDVIIKGRYGHSLRFTSTPKSGKFAVAPKFSEAAGNPITILRSSKQGKDTGRINDFQTEMFTEEDNVLVMASGQKLEFEQSSNVLSSIKSKKITSWKDEKWGTTPQTLISSGRIVFNSTQKEIIAFAKNGIGFSSGTSIGIDAKEDISLNASKIELGTDANEPLILGNKFKTWVENLIDTIGTITVTTPAGPASPLTASPQWAAISSIKARIPTILSDLSFTKKSASVSGEARTTGTLPEPNFKMTEEQKVEALQQKEEAKQKYDTQNTELNDAERKSIVDLHNLKEKEVENSAFVNSKLPEPLISSNDIEFNAKNTSKTIYAGPVDYVDGIFPPPSII